MFRRRVFLAMETAGLAAPAANGAGGTGERVAREPLTGRASRERSEKVGSGPVGERATPTALRAKGPLPLGQDPRQFES